jgi:mono/diheme cytochrome c family protein
MNKHTTFAKRPAAWLLAAGFAAITVFTACSESTTEPPPGPTEPSRATLIDSGTTFFANSCTGCHGSEGKGYAGSTPPLANSDFFMNNRRRVISILINGTEDSLFVNGIPYEGSMPAGGGEDKTDFQIASLVTYIRAVLNDSTVTSCQAWNPNDPSTQDPEGFAKCTKVARSQAEIDADSVTVAEVKAIRDSLAALAP